MMRTILRDGVWAFALIFSKGSYFENIKDAHNIEVAIFTNAILYGFVKNALSAVAFPYEQYPFFSARMDMADNGFADGF